MYKLRFVNFNKNDDEDARCIKTLIDLCISCDLSTLTKMTTKMLIKIPSFFGTFADLNPQSDHLCTGVCLSVSEELFCARTRTLLSA